MKPTIEIVIFVAVMIVVALIANAWRTARQDSQKLAATLAVQNAVMRQAGDREKQRESQLATALATIQTQKRAVHTPQQAAKQLASVLPPLPLPISIQDPDLSVPPAPGQTLSTTLSIPQPDLVPLYDDLQDYRASTAQNAALEKDLSDERTRSAALQHERDAAIAAVHGGTFFVRLKRSAKWFAIGVATGAIAAAVAHH